LATFPNVQLFLQTSRLDITFYTELPKMSKQKEPSEADIVFNRANVALATHQRLVASWLPPRSDAELANAKSQEQLEREEEEMFAPVPELLVGCIR
jgi:hypothetical protein